MSLISQKKLEHFARLARLNINTSAMTLSQQINSMMDFVAQLSSTNTEGVEPLSHPFSIEPHLREDQVTEKDCIEQLQAIAPLFEMPYYLVPKAIESDK